MEKHPLKVVVAVLSVCLLVFCIVRFSPHESNRITRKLATAVGYIKNDTPRKSFSRVLEEEDYKLHHKMYGYNFSAGHRHDRAWTVLGEYNGLKNEDIVMLVTSTSVKKFVFMRERIIQGSRTWMRMFANVFVIIEDSPQVRYALRYCAMTDGPRLTSFKCRNEPTYVLSRKCTNEYYGGPGPCCKVDDIITYITFDRPDLYSHVKFALHCDDDTYWRPDQVMRWLSAIDNSGMMTYPMIGNGNENDPKENVWHIKGCTEVHTNGWYQPMMLNRAALERIKHGTVSYGLTATCSNFDVTHDVGVGPFAWLYGLYHIPVMGTTVGNMEGRDKLPHHFLAVHPLKHARGVDKCDNSYNNWGDMIYDQAMVIGCGELHRPSPGHDPNGLEPKRPDGGQEPIVADFYDGWNFYKDHPQGVDVHHHSFWKNQRVAIYPNGTMLPGISVPGDENKLKIKHVLHENDTVDPRTGRYKGYEVITHFVPTILKLEGYEGTKHSKKHNLLKKWHEFKMSDCVIPGTVMR